MRLSSVIMRSTQNNSLIVTDGEQYGPLTEIKQTHAKTLFKRKVEEGTVNYKTPLITSGQIDELNTLKQFN